MAFQDTKERARALRHQGESIKEIAGILSKSPSTISYWCRDVVLSRKQINLLARKQRRAGAKGRLKAAEIRRQQRIMSTRLQEGLGSADIHKMSRRDLYILGLGLYWGEGYKNENGECALSNSDPDIIRAFVAWATKMYEVRLSDLVLRVSINESHRARVSAVETYWSHVVNVPLSQFTKTSLIKVRAKKFYKNRESHFGTLRVKVRRATNLRRRIIGSLNELRTKIQEITQQI